eukprot:1557209-Pyramimonas_sp.AAC.1
MLPCSPYIQFAVRCNTTFEHKENHWLYSPTASVDETCRGLLDGVRASVVRGSRRIADASA